MLENQATPRSPSPFVQIQGLWRLGLGDVFSQVGAGAGAGGGGGGGGGCSEC